MSIDVHGLTAGYRGRRVIERLDMAALEPGTFTALIGPNGAGKSTLVRAMAGLVRCEGKVLLDGVDILSMPLDRRASCVGFLPQRLAQGVALSVLESVVLALGPPRRERDIEAMEILRQLQIEELALRSMNSLSGGQRQLAGLAQAIARRPKLVLLDEPTSALDPGYQENVLCILKGIAAEGHVVVAVLHDLDLAARHADRVVALRSGSIAADGTPEMVMTPRLLGDLYGVRAMTMRDENGAMRVLVQGLV